MAFATIIPDYERAKLRRLASEISVAETPELDALEELAQLAADIVTRCRDGMQQEMLDRVVTAAQMILPATGDDLKLRLAQSSRDELVSLAALAEEIVAAHTELMHADSDLMGAHDRGDYAAMAPLALEADKQRITFAATSAELTSRLGLGAEAKPDLAAASTKEEEADQIEALSPPLADSPAATRSPTPPTDVPAVGGPAAGSILEGPADGAADPASQPEPPVERRRLRNLIRQVRDTPTG